MALTKLGKGCEQRADDGWRRERLEGGKNEPRWATGFLGVVGEVLGSGRRAPRFSGANKQTGKNNAGTIGIGAN